MKNIALFDFDGTITRRDTLLPYLMMHSVHKVVFLGKGILLVPYLVLYLLHLMDNSSFKIKVLQKFLGGEQEVLLKEVGDEFAERRLSHLLRKEAINRLRWHQ